MRLAHPEWLMLLWSLPVFWFVSLFTMKRAQAKLVAGLGKRMQPLLTREVSPFRRRIKMILRSLALVAAVVALARPQAGKGLSEIKVRGVEMMVVLDVSTSMLAEDVKPSRLQFAKAELSRLLDMLAGDKVGLIGFAGSALLLSPLTNDLSSLKMFLDSLSPYSVSTQGTYFTQALNEAADAFNRGGTEDDDQAKTTRVILVMSDGEDQEKGALDLAKKLSKEGIRIFTMAFGTERGGLIPIRDERGYLRSYKKDSSGKEVLSQVKGEFLKELAKTGQGSFHFATFGGNEARAIKADLDRLQKAEFSSSLATQYEERFQWFLGLALLFLILELLISDRSAPDRVWRGRFEAGLKIGVGWFLASLLSSTFSPCAARAQSLDAILKNNRAVEDLKAEKANEALEGFKKSLADLPDSPEVQFNLGNAFAANKDEEKAISQYDVALGQKVGDELKFKIHFNRAVSLAQKKKLVEALDSYQSALKIKPTSQEVKTNIELLMAAGEGDGEGEGESQEPKEGEDQKESKGQQEQQKPPPQPKDGKDKNPPPKPTPRPFKSEQLSQQDVGRILEELKRQEDQIREKMQREGSKDAPREKDW